MKLYKDEHEVYAEKEQVALLIEDGWSKTKPEVEVEEESIDEETTDDETSESSEDEKSDEQKSPKKTIQRPKKINR